MNKDQQTKEGTTRQAQDESFKGVGRRDPNSFGNSKEKETYDANRTWWDRVFGSKKQN